MTDNEIIKALECCTDYWDCINCPLERPDNCIDTVMIGALDLINRQKAEIERLEGSVIVNNVVEISKIRKTAKTEAIKEFAEKVKPILREMFCVMIDDDEGKCIIEDCKKHSSIPCMNEYCIEENLVAWETKIDNLVKEMTEGEENA